jgi:hypothetical protein
MSVVLLINVVIAEHLFPVEKLSTGNSNVLSMVLFMTILEMLQQFLQTAKILMYQKQLMLDPIKLLKIMD